MMLFKKAWQQNKLCDSKGEKVQRKDVLYEWEYILKHSTHKLHTSFRSSMQNAINAIYEIYEKLLFIRRGSRNSLISSSIQISHHFNSCSATKSNSCKNIKTEWTYSVLFLAEINFNLSFAQRLIIIRVSPTAPIHNLFLITWGRIFNWIRYAGGI